MADPIFNASVGSTPVEICKHACWLTGGVCINVTGGGGQAFVQLFNKRAANVTLGTTVPDDVVPVSPGDNDPLLSGTRPTYWSTALTIAVTTTPTGSTAATCHISAHIE